MTAKDFLMSSLLGKIAQIAKGSSNTNRSLNPASSKRPAGHLRQFVHDTRAAVLMYVTATLPVIVGGALLAIDASRMYSLHTSLQKGTDAMAIAGAAELDASPSAIVRARAAMQRIVENADVFSGSGGENDIRWADVTVRFLTEIPASDATPIPDSMEVSDDNTSPQFDAQAGQKARFVEVVILPRSLTSIFPASFLGGPNVQQARTVSVAGNTQVVCKLMPLFICNPFEPDNYTGTDYLNDFGLFAAAETDSERRKLIQMKAAPGGSADYFPGDFGFLRTNDTQGAQELADALAKGTVEACFSQSGVETETGHKQGPIKAALNTRFGLYTNPGFGNNNGNGSQGSPGGADWPYRPAPNVRKGQDYTDNNKKCKHWTPDDPVDAKPLPLDDCFLTDPVTCTDMDGRRGNGNWTVEGTDNYWHTNYGTTASTLGTYNGKSPANASRYDVYMEEITAGMVGNPAPPGSGVPLDNGDPKLESCWNGDALDITSAHRRLINGAILNCQALENHPDFNLKGHVENVPVLAFAEFFMVWPMLGTCNGSCTNPVTAEDVDDRTLWTELRSVLRQGNADAVAYDQVQLYR